MKKLLILSLLIGFNSLTSNGQKIAKDKKEIIAALDSKEPIYANTALKIWEKAEIGYQ